MTDPHADLALGFELARRAVLARLDHRDRDALRFFQDGTIAQQEFIVCRLLDLIHRLAVEAAMGDRDRVYSDMRTRLANPDDVIDAQLRLLTRPREEDE